MSFDPTENVPPFPTTTLPGWLEAMVTATAAAHQVPADLPGVLTLAALATVCAGRVQVSPKAGWVEGANLYAAVAMPPGTGKSPVFSVIMKPIGDAEELLQADAGQAFAAAKTRREIAEKRAAHLRTEASRTADPLERERLTVDASAEAAEAGRHEYYMPRLLADDVTPETLATLLYQQAGRIAIISDEGGVFAQMLGRYSGGVANLDTYLKAHSGGRILVDRRARTERIDEPRLTLGLAVQPQLLRSVGSHKALQGLGLTARFLFAMPPANIGSRDMPGAPPVPPEIDAAYATGLESLTLRFANATMTTIGLSSDAAGLFRDFQGTNEQRLAPEGPLRPVAEWGNKLPGHVLRLAGILHVAHNNGVGDASITAATMSAAIELAEYFAAHYLAVASLLIQTDADAYAHRILEWIRTRRPESFTQRDLHRSLRATVSRSADLDEPLRLLVERNHLTRAEPVTERRGPGRRPSPTFIPHHSLLQAPVSNLPPAT